jgi:hypothetical protein
LLNKEGLCPLFFFYLQNTFYNRVKNSKNSRRRSFIMTNNIKKLLGGAIALAGAFMAFSDNKEEKKSEIAPVEGSNSSTTEVKTETKSEEVNEPEEKTEE